MTCWFGIKAYVGLNKTFFFRSSKVRFLAMTMSEQARHCSFGLTKTFFFVPRKLRFAFPLRPKLRVGDFQFSP